MCYLKKKNQRKKVQVPGCVNLYIVYTVHRHGVTTRVGDTPRCRRGDSLLYFLPENELRGVLFSGVWPARGKYGIKVAERMREEGRVRGGGGWQHPQKLARKSKGLLCKLCSDALGKQESWALGLSRGRE